MAEKEVINVIKLQIEAGKATPAPPVGPALGSSGVNIMQFVKEFNDKTANQPGMIIPVVISVYKDKSFTFVTKVPPVAVLIKKKINLQKGSGKPNKDKVAKITKAQVKEIAEQKMEDLNAASVEAAFVPKEEKMKKGKRYVEAAKLVDTTKLYESNEALDIIEKMPKAKFDETVELHVKLGVDSKHADQQVRGTVVLPNGTGKSLKVLVFAKGDKAKEAEAAGADFVGAEELVPKIEKENWFDYDVIVATPDMMGVIGRLGKVLGPKGLMPNPKSGTVTMDVTKAVAEIKSGKVEYRLDKTNIIHLGIGKVSFGAEKLQENYQTIIDAIIKAKPVAAKGQYIKSVALTTTMGPSLYINQK